MPHESLIEKLYAEIVVQCEVETCSGVFIPTEPAEEPVELWAVRAATEAEALGWSASDEKHVTCPKHGVSGSSAAQPLAPAGGFAAR